MPEPQSVKEILSKILNQDLQIIKGSVVSSNPISVKASNDEKLIIPSQLLCVPHCLTDYQVDLDIEEDGQKKRITATIRNHLKIGDEVWLLSFKRGKKYLIIDREG